MKLILLIFALVTFSIKSFASDSTHQICEGFTSTNVSSLDVRKISLRYDEKKAGGSGHRQTTIQMTLRDENYFGSTMSDGDSIFSIKVVDVNDSGKVAYDGTVEVLDDNGLSLNGIYDSAPISVVLACHDI